QQHGPPQEVAAMRRQLRSEDVLHQQDQGYQECALQCCHEKKGRDAVQCLQYSFHHSSSLLRYLSSMRSSSARSFRLSGALLTKWATIGVKAPSKTRERKFVLAASMQDSRESSGV